MGPEYGPLASFKGPVLKVVYNAIVMGSTDSKLGAHTRGPKDLLWTRRVGVAYSLCSCLPGSAAN